MKITGKSCLLILIALALPGCRAEHLTSQKPEKLQAARVNTAKAAMKTAPLQVEILGTVQAVHSAVIAAKVSGNITSLNVNLGDKVRQGEILIKIDAGELQSKLDQAKAELTRAERNLTREKNLLKKGAATGENVKTQQDTVSISTASYQGASDMMQHTIIKAPFDGLVTKKLINLGDMATPGRPLLQIDNEKELQVISHLPETMLSAIHIGQELKITVPALKGQIIGKVAELAPIADPVSRTALMKLSLPPADGLRPGQFAKVNITKDTKQAVMIPKTAVFPIGQLERVFVVKAQTAHLRLVKTGAASGDEVEIISGLAANEEIVTSTTLPLTDGQPLKIETVKP